jgi:hypothetical protein
MPRGSIAADSVVAGDACMAGTEPQLSMASSANTPSSAYDRRGSRKQSKGFFKFSGMHKPEADSYSEYSDAESAEVDSEAETLTYDNVKSGI